MARKTTVQLNPKAVVVYCRVSTTEQGKSGLGLEAQIATCQRLIESEGLFSFGTFTGVFCTNPRKGGLGNLVRRGVGSSRDMCDERATSLKTPTPHTFPL